MSSNTSEMLEQYTGKFLKRIFRSEDSLYCVYLYQSGKDTTTVVGEDLPEVPYPVTFSGRWTHNKNYGLQFEAEIVVNQLPETGTDIINFIAALHIGIGRKKARQMLDLAGVKNFWNTLAETPLIFTSVVNLQRLERLQAKVNELAFVQNIVQMCGTDLKIDTIRYKRICSVFREQLGEIVTMIQENPFILIQAGFPFLELDAFACKKTGIARNDHKRMLGAAQQALLDAQAKCYATLPENMMLDAMDKLLRKFGGVQREDCQLFLAEAVRRNELAECNDSFYLNRSFEEESTLVNVFSSLNAIPAEKIDRSLFDTCIADYEADKGFTLSKDQRTAVWTALTRSICIITGGPGTGKSTILDAIRSCWKSFFPSDKCVLMAPSGRAAVRMTEVTGEDASTIHSRLQLQIGNQSFEKMDTDIQLVYDELVIVDECSMVDQTTAAALAVAMAGRYAKKRQHLILVGDPDQLPSVSYGNVLADLIESNVLPVCSLGTVYRQAEGNPIITNSGRIRTGDTQMEWTPSFKGFNNGSDLSNKMAACKFYASCVKQFGIENVSLLSPYHRKTEISTDALNKILQEIINPDVGQSFLPYGKIKFRLHDRVMMLKNTELLNNGDIGNVIDVVNTTSDDSEAHLKVEFENGTIQEFPRENLYNLDLAYAITVHKSQGTQSRAVIMILPDEPSAFLRRNVIYTGITRSKEYFAVFGPQKVLTYAIKNNRQDKRYTSLAERLRQMQTGNKKVA